MKSVLAAIWKNRKLCKNILVVLLFVLTWICGARYGASHVEIPEPEIIEVYVTPDIVPIRSNQDDIDREQNVSEIAKVLYGYRYNSEIDLEGITWVILNRVDNQAEFKNFNTVVDVCQQPSQWMGYDENNPVLENLYEIADGVLTKYENNTKRLFGKEYLYFEWSSEYIVFRTTFSRDKNCRYWRSY